MILIKSDLGAAGQLFTLEAMYYKKIVIATSTGVLKEMVSNGVDGFIVNNPVAEIPDILHKLRRDPQSFSLWGERAHEKVVDNYSDEKFNSQLEISLRNP